MSREIENELEERRVIRLLGGAAEAVAPLHEAEVATLLRTAVARPRTARARRHAFSRRPQLLSVAGVAAAAALALMLPVSQPEPERRASSPPASLQAPLVVFPEGSALSLLLSLPGERRA